MCEISLKNTKQKLLIQHDFIHQDISIPLLIDNLLKF